MNEIYLKDIWTIYRPGDYKAHFAKINEHGEDPLVQWCENPQRFVGWQSWKNEQQNFGREFIFSMMRLHEDPQTYLFGGVFRVTKHAEAHEQGGHHNEAVLTKQGEQFIGRLILQRKKSVRNVRLNFENRYNGETEDMLVVKEILRSQYTCD